MAAPTLAPRRTQAQRSAATRRRLIDAAVVSLIESGYAYTTVVEVCRRAGLTRGAFHHHFDDLGSLLIGVLERLYERLLEAAPEDEPDRSLEASILRAWERVGRPEFKAVIEIWLAARNDPALGRSLAPAIADLSRLFDPGPGPDAAFRRLASETMIGLALGRATSPDGAPVAHERGVISLLTSLAREHEHRRRPS